MTRLSDSRIIRTKELCERTSLSRTTIYRLERAGDLPPKRRISSNRVGWLESEIDEWWASKAAAGAGDAE